MGFSNPHKAWDADDRLMSQACGSLCKPFIHAPCLLPTGSVPMFLPLVLFPWINYVFPVKISPSTVHCILFLSPSRALLLYLFLLSLHRQFSILLISVSLQTCSSSILSKALFDLMQPSIYYPISVPLCSKTLQNRCLYFSLHFSFLQSFFENF